MKCLITSFFLIFVLSNAIAQKPDKALVRVKYAYSHMLDTNQKENFYKETMMLIAGKDASVYLSYDKILRDIEVKAAFEEQAKQQASTGIRTLKSPPRKRQLNDIEHYYFANEDKFFTREQLGISYLVEQKPEKIDWKIAQEKLVIAGINCNKATAYFKGRNWIVWFAEELPFVSGPWKLIGLPGLIIQAHDEKKEVLFEFAGLDKVEENQTKAPVNTLDEYTIKKLGSSNFLTENEIRLPEKTVMATAQEVARLKEARNKDPQGFAKAQLAAMGFGGLTQMSQGASSTTLPRQATIFNNPIEKKTTPKNK